VRGTKAKAMRKYVRKQFPFLSASPLYTPEGYGKRTVVLAQQCQRDMYQKIKAAYKRSRTDSTDMWRNYESRQSN